MWVSLQGTLEAIYRISAPDIRPFLINRAQFNALPHAPQHREADEWVLLRESGDHLDLAVFLADEHVTRLSAAQCVQCLYREAFRPFCSAVEAVSHFLLLTERAKRQEPVRLLELEAQAEVDKYLAARLKVGVPVRSEHLLRRLFRDVEFAPDLTAEERDRYREAGRLAEGFCRMLDGLPSNQMIVDHVRAFYHRSGGERLDQLRAFAA
jgi:hypothetical protein